MMKKLLPEKIYFLLNKIIRINEEGQKQKRNTLCKINSPGIKKYTP